MSDGGTHGAAGIFMGLASVAAIAVSTELTLDPLTASGVFLACWLGSLFPDVDTRLSTIRRLLDIAIPAATFVLIFVFLTGMAEVRLLFAVLALSLMYFSVQFLKHRKFTHTIIGLVLLGVPLLGWPFLYVGWLVGCASHLILDREFKLL